MFSVTIEADVFKSFMKELKASTNNLSPAFDSFGRYLKKETNTQFVNEVDPDGKPWEPLKPSTLARKKTPFKLRETLDMFNSVYYIADKDRFEFGIKDFKYQFHHEGTSKMAARVVVGITNQRRGEANRLVILQIKRVRSKKRR